MWNVTFPNINQNNENIALIEGNISLRYADLFRQIQCFSSGLLEDKNDLAEERVATFLPNSAELVIALQGIWQAGGLAVPLNVASAIDELEHYLSSAGVTRLILNQQTKTDELLSLCDALKITVIDIESVSVKTIKNLPKIDEDRRCLMLFTSGTTNKPKGVVHTKRSLSSQISCLLEAWSWTSYDKIPMFLPPHHIHGLINILCCGLSAGATVYLYPKFEHENILQRISKNTFTVFMAVPTVYHKIIQYLETLDDEEKKNICTGFSKMRLNISGSAACPITLFEQWKKLTGQTLLERYGMTEIGMGISNPYNGERKAGFVGIPLPRVNIQLFDENNSPIIEENVPGEIRIKSDNVFLEYWNNEKATEESFRSGWFCSGDMAIIENGYYRIMGRTSIDIIKSGGYKLSALEIESTLLNHDAISEIAVIGVADETWGEAVAAIIVTAKDSSLTHEHLKSWCENKISAYKVPKFLKIVDELPRNAMGKVTKPKLKHYFEK